jgi:hypothetical protein
MTTMKTSRVPGRCVTLSPFSPARAIRESSTCLIDATINV